MDERSFKKSHKPAACTQAPWEHLVPEGQKEAILSRIRQESIAIYGQSMDECPKRLVCMGKTCIGRPLPTKSKTFKPYLEELKKTHQITNDEMFLTNCELCPIVMSCKSLCPQVYDFTQRDKSQEPELIYKESIENLIPHPQPIDTKDLLGSVLSSMLKVPWDVLSAKRSATVKKYLYEGKDFLMVAKELGYYDQSRARYEFYAALTKLSKYAAMRAFMTEHADKITTTGHFSILNDIFFHNKTLTEAANTHGLTKQGIQQMISRYTKKYEVTWKTFVRKKGNKVIYNVPELLK